MKERLTSGIPNGDFAQGLMESAKDHPESTAGIGQAMVRAGVQILIEEFGYSTTMGWLAQMCIMMNSVVKGEIPDFSPLHFDACDARQAN